MKILANKEIKNLFHSLSLVFGVTFLLAEVFLWLSYRRLSLLLLILFLLAGGAVWAVQQAPAHVVRFCGAGPYQDVAEGGIPRKRRAEGAEQRACPDRLPETAQNPYLPVLRQYNKRNSAMEVEEG